MNGDFRIVLDGPDLEKGFTGDLLQPQEAGGGGVKYGFFLEDPKVKRLESNPDETLVERLCGKLTRHRFALGLAAADNFAESGKTHYYCLCRLCRKQFWTERRPKNMMEVSNEQ